jgi:hypothetical protein
MAGPVFAFAGVSALLFIEPHAVWLIAPYFWVDIERSDPLAVRVTAKYAAMLISAATALVLALLTLAGALPWRWLGPRPTH